MTAHPLIPSQKARPLPRTNWIHRISNPCPHAVGTRLRLVSMGSDEPDPVPPGTEGTVTGGNGAQVHVDWDNGRTLSLALGVGSYTVLSANKCDFCSTDSPTWDYPCNDVEVLDGAMSLGDWGACDACHDLIEAGEWGDLAERCVDLWAHKHTVSHYHALVMMLDIHEKFAASRIGPPVPHRGGHMRGILIPADESLDPIELDVAEDYPGVGIALAHLMDKDQVWIERVPWRAGQLMGVDLWVDEEGLLQVPIRPRNGRAERIAGYPHLVGDALLLGNEMALVKDEEDEWEEERSCSLPPRVTVQRIQELW